MLKDSNVFNSGGRMHRQQLLWLERQQLLLYSIISSI